MRTYEELFIVKPDAPDEEVDALVETLRTQLVTLGATVDKIDKWGKRRLAYRVDKYREGTYVLFQFTAAPEHVYEFERRLRVTDSVLKFLTVRVDETLKRLDKRKKVCRFCVEKIDDINYKDVKMLHAFVAERGKIVPRRISGVCAPHQRRLTDAIKKARNIALLPFAAQF